MEWPHVSSGKPARAAAFGHPEALANRQFTDFDFEVVNLGLKNLGGFMNEGITLLNVSRKPDRLTPDSAIDSSDPRQRPERDLLPIGYGTMDYPLDGYPKVCGSDCMLNTSRGLFVSSKLLALLWTVQ